MLPLSMGDFSWIFRFLPYFRTFDLECYLSDPDFLADLDFSDQVLHEYIRGKGVGGVGGSGADVLVWQFWVFSFSNNIFRKTFSKNIFKKKCCFFENHFCKMFFDVVQNCHVPFPLRPPSPRTYNYGLMEYLFWKVRICKERRMNNLWV